MANRFQDLSRGSIRRSIGVNLNIVKLGAATAASIDKSSLEDTKNLIGPDDEFNGQEVLIYETTDELAPQDESSIVSNFTSSSNIATCVPIFTAEITTLDKYEMWKRPWKMADINEVINQAINEATGKVYPIKETHTAFTWADKYLYDELSGFTHLTKVEYVASVLETEVEACESAWTAGSNVTATADTFFVVEGTYGAKLVVAAGAAATAILGYVAISSLDLSGYDTIEFSMYSSIALTAGQIELHLSSTAAIASAEETLDVPAMSAATKYRHSVALANPQSDTAIISVGLYQVADVGACTLYIDKIVAVNSKSKEYIELPDEYWHIAKGTTPYLQISTTGLLVTGTDVQLRLTGHQLVSRLDADATSADIDPAFIIDKATERLLIAHAKSSSLDIQDKAGLATYWRAEADKKLRGMTTNLGNTKGVS